MSQGAANETKLAQLHDILADVLIEQVSVKGVEIDEEGNALGKEQYLATPATLTVALKFLKDNDITCVPTEDNKIGGLKEKLEQRKKGHGKVIELSPQGDERAIQ